ncbi:hypothetical protein ACH52_0225 [Eubacterium limosum]|nr:hypothetical protein ACH52_0225 [Eubacterium limosum]
MMNTQNKWSFPTVAEAQTYIPLTYYDFTQAKQKGLTGSNGFSEKYLKLQIVYKYGLMQYLSDMLMLEEYEKEMAESPLRFLPCPENEQSVYQKYSMTGFKYIYLRNNLYIEKLESEDLQILEECAEKETYNSDALLELTARTGREVITNEDPAVDAEDFYLIYGNRVSGVKSAPNNAVVLEIATGSAFDENGNYISLENEQKKDAAIIALKRQMLSEMEGILEMPVAVFIK